MTGRRKVTRRLRFLLAAGLVLLTGCAGSGGSGGGSAGRSGGGSRGSHPAALPAPQVRLPLAACPAPRAATTSQSPLPDLTLPCLSDRGPAQVALRTLTGAPTVLNLWASWCGPCATELPAFARLSTRAGDRLRVIGVQTADDAHSAEALLGPAHARYANLFDEQRRLLSGLPVAPALPVTVFVRSDGTVAKVYQGPALTDASLDKLVVAALGVRV